MCIIYSLFTSRMNAGAYKQTGINNQSLKRLSQVLADSTIRQSKHWQIGLSFDKFFKTHVNNVRAPNLNGNCIAWIHLISFGCALWILFKNCKKRSLFSMEMTSKKIMQQRNDAHHISTTQKYIDVNRDQLTQAVELL